MVRCRGRERARPPRRHAPASAVFAALAAPLPSRAGASGRHSWCVLVGPRTPGCVGTRTADTAPRARTSAAAPVHPCPAAPSGTATSSAPPEAARRRVEPTGLAWSRTAPVADESARLPVFSRDLFHDLDLEVTLGDQLLQPAVLLLQLAQPFDVRGLQLPELLPPRVDRGVAHAVAFGHLRDRRLVR